MSNSATPWIAPCQASLSFTVFPTLLKLMSIESGMLSNHLILCPLFSSCPESFPASRSFPKSRLFASGGQSIGASVSVIPINIQGWFPLGLTGLISVLCEGLSRVSSNTTKSVLSDNYFASRVPLKHWQCHSILLISDVAVEILSVSDYCFFFEDVSSLVDVKIISLFLCVISPWYVQVWVHFYLPVHGWGSVFDCFWRTLGCYFLEHWLHPLQSLTLIGCTVDPLICLLCSVLYILFISLSLSAAYWAFYPALLQLINSSFSWFTLLFNHLFTWFQCMFFYLNVFLIGG